MNCQHYRYLMFDYYEGVLDSPVADEIKLHLSDCDYCRRQFELTEQENQILKDTSDIPELSDTFNSSVMAMIKAGPVSNPVIVMEKKPRFRWLPAISKVSVAAILLLSCLYVPGILPHIGDSKSPQDAALPNNSVAPQYSIMSQNDIMEKAATKQIADVNAGAGVASQEVTENSSQNDMAASSDQILPDQTQPEMLMIASLPDSDNPAVNAAQVNPAPTTSEASRSLLPSMRLAGVNNNPSLYNIPDEFVLIETNKISESQVLYIYEDTAVQKRFVVNLSSAEPAAEIMTAEDQSVIKAKEPKTIDLDNLAVLNNESQKTVEYNGATWQISVSGNMSQEELDQITGEISLEPLTSQP